MGPGSKGAEPQTVEGGRGPRAQSLRCGADGARSPTRLVSARPFLIPEGPGPNCRAPSASVSPGSQPRLPCCPRLPGVQCPPPHPIPHRPGEVSPLAASRALARAAGSPRSPSSSPRQSHRRRHSAASRCISGRCGAGPTCAAAASGSVCERAARARAGLGPGRGRGGVPADTPQGVGPGPSDRPSHLSVPPPGRVELAR